MTDSKMKSDMLVHDAVVFSVSSVAADLRLRALISTFHSIAAPREFSCLDDRAVESVEDAAKVAKHASQSLGTRAAAAFICHVADRTKPFDRAYAMAHWDRDQQTAFLAWEANPWYLEGYSLHQGGLVGVADSPEGLKAMLKLDELPLTGGVGADLDLRPKWDFANLHAVEATDDNGEEEVDGYGPEVMTITEFNRACQAGAYTSDDGVGYYGTTDQESTEVVPCDGTAHEHAHDRDAHTNADAMVRLTHVWWHGK